MVDPEHLISARTGRRGALRADVPVKRVSG
jgi:hypothetical protein